MAGTDYARLSGLDSLLLRMDKDASYNHTLKLTILDPSSDPQGWSFDRYRSLIERHVMVNAPMLRRRYLPTPFGLHHPIWVDDPGFDLDVHLLRVGCPAPGGMTELCSLVEQLYSRPLDHQRPPWQIWIVEGLEGGRVAVLNLLHHAYSDGTGVRTLVESLASAKPFDPPAGELPAWAPNPLPSKRRRLAWAVSDLPAVAKSVPPAMRAIPRRVRLERRFARTQGSGKPSSLDRRQPQPFGGRLMRGRRFVCRSFPLEAMLEVRSKVGTTVNDVFLSCVAGSVRSLLGEEFAVRTKPMIGSIAFSTRPPDKSDTPSGNYSYTDEVWLPTDIADPIERLRAASASARVTKDHFKIVSTADPLALVDAIPGGILGTALRFDERSEGRYSPGCNIIISNVAGFQEPRYIGRWQMERWFSTGQLLHGATVNFTAWSYSDQFNLCILSGSPKIPDAWPLMAGFGDALEELVSAAGAITGHEEAV